MSAATDFWSQRKAGVRAEAEAEIAVGEGIQQETERQALESKSDEEILSELELPNPDTLGKGDDFSAFMTKAVPERIKRRALRKLWLSNPALANLDGLIDYGDDFTDSATVVENLQTAYQVGKGMLKHVLEMSKSDDCAQETTEIDLETPVEPAGELLEEMPDGELDCNAQPSEPDYQVGAQFEDETFHEEISRPARRMRFLVSSETKVRTEVTTKG